MTARGGTPLVAIVDDDRSVQRSIKDLMESAGMSVRCFGSAAEFLASDQRTQAGCLVADIRMPGMSGIQLHAKLRAEGSRIPTIFITAHGDAEVRTQAMKAGAIEVLFKPFDDEVLLERVRAALTG
jgi:FixJ family two-component response regulator